MNKYQKARNLIKNKKQLIREGEWYRVHDKRTAGHKSIITKVNKNGNIEHVPITHSPRTRGIKNIKLQENPQKGKQELAYVVKNAQKTQIAKVGKKQDDMKIKNATDKSIIRHIKNNAKNK